MIESMRDAFSLKGRTVLITGGNQGIGRGISRAMAESGADVAIMCRKKESAEAVSYTHLDVYKRQIMRWAPAVPLRKQGQLKLRSWSAWAASRRFQNGKAELQTHGMRRCIILQWTSQSL